MDPDDGLELDECTSCRQPLYCHQYSCEHVDPKTDEICGNALCHWCTGELGYEYCRWCEEEFGSGFVTPLKFSP